MTTPTHNPSPADSTQAPTQAQQLMYENQALKARCFDLQEANANLNHLLGQLFERAGVNTVEALYDIIDHADAPEKKPASSKQKRR